MNGILPVPRIRTITAIILVLILAAVAGILFLGLFGFWTLTGPQAASSDGSISLSESEQRWISAHQNITVCPDPDYPPFEWYNESEAYSGISADYLHIISQRTGLRIDDKRQENFSTCIGLIRDHRIDILGAVFTSDLRKTYLNYTDPYYQPPQVIITRNSVTNSLTLDDLNGMTVTVVDGYTVHELLKEKYPDIRIQVAPNIRTALRSVSLGMADAYLGDVATASWYVEKEGLTNLHVAGEYKPDNPQLFHLAIGVRNDEPELREILNKGLASITPLEKEQVIHRWVSSSLRPPVDTRVLAMLSISIGLLVLIVVVIMLWNRTLKKAVVAKTRELSRELEERKKAQASLAESEDKYRTILESIQDVYYRSDQEGVLVMISPSGATLLGYATADEILGKDIAKLLYTSRNDREIFLAALETNGFVQDYEVDLKRKDGTIITVSTNSHHLYRPDGTIEGIEGIFRDISQRKQSEMELIKKNQELHAAYGQLTVAEEELKSNYRDMERSKQALEQARAKLNLLNTVALQDIQNAVFSLAGYFELEKPAFEGDSHRPYLDKQIRLVQSISESLAFIRNYQNLGLSPPRWQNVQQSFLMAISHCDLSKLSRNMQVRGLEIYADALLEQVFYAIAENVLMHARTATEIRLHYYETDDGLVLVFEDNGAGIPPENKTKIFEKHKKVQEGIGLFLAREILSVTGIAIRECGEPERGARFEMAVPKNAYRFTERDGNTGRK